MAAPKKVARSFAFSDTRLGVVFLLPAVTLLGGLILYPFFNVIWMSFTNKNTLSPRARFVGLENYIDLLVSQEFWHALKTDLLWVLGVVAFGAVLGLMLSLLLHAQIAFRNVARGVVLFPYLVPTVVAVLVWRYIYNDLTGVANYVMIQLGLVDQPLQWLADPGSAMLSVIVVGIWKYSPFFVISLLARLQVIPLELYEAARVDGANSWTEFRHITLPSIMPVLLLAILLRSIWAFNEFDIIYLLTGGGPIDSTTTLPLLVYLRAFGEYKMGEAAAIAVLMFLILFLASLAYIRWFERREDDLV